MLTHGDRGSERGSYLVIQTELRRAPRLLPSRQSLILKPAYPWGWSAFGGGQCPFVGECGQGPESLEWSCKVASPFPPRTIPFPGVPFPPKVSLWVSVWAFSSRGNSW